MIQLTQTIEYLNALFCRDEYVCVSVKDDFKTTASVRVCEYIDDSRDDFSGEFICINPLVHKGTRSDSNVASFRSFLVEFDKGTKEEQLDTIHSSGLPYTTLVDSANKSLHAVIRLTEPLSDLKEYRAISRPLTKFSTLSDAAVSNPSRFSRLAGVQRRSTGKLQNLLDVRAPVTKDKLIDFLNKYVPNNESAKKRAPNGCRKLSQLTLALITKGQFFKSRHKSIMTACFDLAHGGFSESEAIQLMLTTGEKFFPEKDCSEIERLVKWVYQAVLNET